MKLRTSFIAMVLAGFAAAATAGQAGANMRPVNAIELLSQATGLTIHEVEIALGPSATAYDHAVGYERAHQRFRQAVGRTLYEQIMGRGELTAQQIRELAAMARDHQTSRLAGK